MAEKYKYLVVEDNQLRGIENCTLIQVLDQNNVCCDSAELARESFDTLAEYRKAIQAEIDRFKKEWSIKSKTYGSHV